MNGSAMTDVPSSGGENSGKERDRHPYPSSSLFPDLARALSASSQLLAALLVAGAAGFGLDRLAGSSPLFLLAGIGAGFVAGIMIISRMLKDPRGSSGSGKGTERNG